MSGPVPVQTVAEAGGEAARPKAVASDLLVTLFRRLFENEFASLDGIAISERVPAGEGLPSGMRYLDESAALGRMLGETGVDVPYVPADPVVHALHESVHADVPDAACVVSGWSRHLQALGAVGMDPPPSTSMMVKRGVLDLREHLVEPGALVGAALPDALEQATAVAARNGMKHLLLVTTEGYVVVAAPIATEAMAHWHNVEFAARVECMRIEELVVHGPQG